MKTAIIAALGVFMLCVVGAIGVGGYMVYQWQPDNGPVVPQPVVPAVGLGQLVADATDRDDLKQFFADMATVVRTGEIQSTDDFRTAYRVAVQTIKSAGRLKSVSVVDVPISERIAIAIGKDSRPLDPDTKIKLAATLDSIAGEF